MKRITGLVLTLGVLAAPVALQAQKPSDVAETRSADVYMNNAKEKSLASEKKELYEKALDAAQQAVAKYPDNPKPYYQMGLAYHKLGNIPAADSMFRKAETMYPEYGKDIAPERKAMWTETYNDAVKRIKAGDAAGGAAALKLAAKLDPTRPEPAQVLGSIYMQTSDIPNAEAAYKDEIAVLRGPGRAKLDAKTEATWADMELNAVKALATMYASEKRYPEAEEQYRELLKKDPQNAAVLSNLGIILTRAGKTADANAVYNQLLARPDLNGTQLMNVGIGLHNAGQYDKAVEAFGRASTISPFSYDIMDFEVNSMSGVIDALVPKAAVKGADADKAALIAQYNKLVDVGTRALALSPLDATMVMRVAAAQRGLADNDVANTAAWKNKVLASLQRNAALPISLTDIGTVSDEKTVTISGDATGVAAAAGTPVKVKFELIDKDGNTVSSKELDIPAPAKDAKAQFTVTIDAPATVVSWKYELM